ncbi:hypothetical protein BT96DRAFT_921580 [Gymnopus androsaceus JB14]|uniref:GED domain-containing protein n=1 Tax=Gymnopus androsaceus JB14 TaxID=1447944 RepID=A0A6A4HJZ8_9AGAR|nr:hypothetical protein BT96DRAFT_921580 [Gymnopus androsaceus JB14]
MLAQAGLNLSKEELLNKVSPSSDGYEIELTLMAEVRGYYTVAYKRLIDYVPGFIDLVFVRGIEKELQSFLVSELKMGTPAGSALCASLLEEDPSITLKRNELVSQTERLANVQRELVMFGIRR